MKIVCLIARGQQKVVSASRRPTIVVPFRIAGIQVDGAHMQWLMHISDEVREKEQSLSFVDNLKWRLRRAGLSARAFQHEGRGLDRLHHIVRASTEISQLIVVMASGVHIGKMVAEVALEGLA